MLFSKEASEVLAFHNKDFKKALKDLYPELKFDLKKFEYGMCATHIHTHNTRTHTFTHSLNHQSHSHYKLTSSYTIIIIGQQWSTIARRKYFNSFALRKGFNPLDVHKWYSLCMADVTKEPVSAHARTHTRVRANEQALGYMCAEKNQVFANS